MGGEFKTKGVQVALGPVVGPLGRLTTHGRNWESMLLDYPKKNSKFKLIFSRRCC